MISIIWNTFHRERGELIRVSCEVDLIPGSPVIRLVCARRVSVEFYLYPACNLKRRKEGEKLNTAHGFWKGGKSR